MKAIPHRIIRASCTNFEYTLQSQGEEEEVWWSSYPLVTRYSASCLANTRRKRARPFEKKAKTKYWTMCEDQVSLMSSQDGGGELKNHSFHARPELSRNKKPKLQHVQSSGSPLPHKPHEAYMQGTNKIPRRGRKLPIRRCQ